MKIIVVGATGTLGSAVTAELQKDHDVVRAAYRDEEAEIDVDITDLGSIRAMYERVGEFDALVSPTGAVHFGPLQDMNPDDWQLGLNNKLMGQINLVMEGMRHIKDGGSFTLTAGIISKDPIRYGASATTVCRALEGFAAAAALELPRGMRVNVVSPTILQESVDMYGSAFAGFEPVPAAIVAKAFRKSVDGAKNGETLFVHGRV